MFNDRVLSALFNKEKNYSEREFALNSWYIPRYCLHAQRLADWLVFTATCIMQPIMWHAYGLITLQRILQYITPPRLLTRKHLQCIIIFALGNITFGNEFV